jgi:hypothetical protein
MIRFQNRGSPFFASLIRPFMKQAGYIELGDLSLRWYTDFLAQLEIWMFWKLRRPRPGKPCLH